jgi:hypothetical protein
MTPTIPITYQVLNEWQICPKCEGSGTMYGGGILSDPCTLCKGKMIISRLSGTPPPDDYKGPIGILTTERNVNTEIKKINHWWTNLFK